MASKRKHVRIICPHCHKRVRLAPPRSPFGWLRPVPCPNCHIPIRPAQIKAQLEPAPAESAPEGQAETPAGEAAQESEAEAAPTAEGAQNTAAGGNASTPESDQEAGSSR